MRLTATLKDVTRLTYNPVCQVDLSTHEATHTLQEMDAKLAQLRDERSVRVIGRNISAARVPYTVKVLVYKNGDGRMKTGSLLVGSSVAGVRVFTVFYSKCIVSTDNAFI